MNAAIFYVSFRGHKSWFEYSIRTLEKFGSGFSSVTVAVPNGDVELFKPFCDQRNIRLRPYLEMPGKPFVHHMLSKCEADIYCPHDAQLIVHLDSDSIFVEKFSLDTYLHEGRPILMREHFDDFRHYPSRYGWKACTDYAIRLDCQWETMCRHPSIHWRPVYRAMRDRVEYVHGIPFTQYVLFQKDSFAQSFCEFVALGNWAMQMVPESYQWVDSIITPGKYWADPKWEKLGLPSAETINGAPSPLHPDGRGNGAIGEYWAEKGWNPIALWHNADGSIENRPYPANPMRYYWSKYGTEKFRAELDALVA